MAKSVFTKPHVSLFRTVKFRVAALIVTFIISATIAVAMFIGIEAGNFVVQIESGNVEKSISLCTNLEDIENNNSFKYVDRLTAPALYNMTDNTLSNITHTGRNDLLKVINDYEKYQQQINGESVDQELNFNTTAFYIYTFYIVNNSSTGTNVGISINYSNATRGIDDAIRVLTYNSTLDIAHVYQKPDKEGFEGDYSSYYYQPQPFESEGVIVNNEGDGTHIMGNGEVESPHYLGSANETEASLKYCKYTVIIWLEGHDLDCTEKLYNSTIRLSMKISIIN